VDEVFKNKGNRDMRGIKETKELKLGDAQDTPIQIQGNQKA